MSTSKTPLENHMLKAWLMFVLALSSLFFASSWISPAWSADEGLQVTPLGSDLQDIHRFEPQMMLGDATEILASMQPGTAFNSEWFDHGNFSQVAQESGKDRWRGPIAVQSPEVLTTELR